MTESRTLTSTEILAAATEELTDRGEYLRISADRLPEWPFTNSRVFEDRYGIVAVVVFETWQELKASWPEAQASLSQFISRHLAKGEPKAWDGYLALFTPGRRGDDGQDEWMKIRYDTSRVRKLVSTGEDLRSLRDVKASLIPLLPLHPGNGEFRVQESIFDLLPGILAREEGVELPDAEVVVQAFEDQRNMMSALHRHRGHEL